MSIQSEIEKLREKARLHRRLADLELHRAAVMDGAVRILEREQLGK